MVNIKSQGHLVKHIITLISAPIIILILEAHIISVATSSMGRRGDHSTMIARTT